MGQGKRQLGCNQYHPRPGSALPSPRRRRVTYLHGYRTCFYFGFFENLQYPGPRVDTWRNGLAGNDENVVANRGITRANHVHVKKNEVPQDIGSLAKKNVHELCYAVDEKGNYTAVPSSGWEVKTLALNESL